LKFLAIDVQLFTLKFYKTGSEFITKKLQCATVRHRHSYTAPAAAGCKLQLLLIQNCRHFTYLKFEYDVISSS